MLDHIVVNIRDLRQTIQAAFEANSQGLGVAKNQHLTWVVMDPSQFATDADISNAVVDEKAWAAVVGM